MDPLILAERLRKFRKQKRLCQKEIAARLGISRVYYSRLENGRARPGFELYARISVFLDSGANRRPFSSTAISQNMLCELCRSLTEKDRSAIGKIILRMSNR